MKLFLFIIVTGSLFADHSKTAPPIKPKSFSIQRFCSWKLFRSHQQKGYDVDNDHVQLDFVLTRKASSVEPQYFFSVFVHQAIAGQISEEKLGEFFLGVEDPQQKGLYYLEGAPVNRRSTKFFTEPEMFLLVRHLGQWVKLFDIIYQSLEDKADKPFILQKFEEGLWFLMNRNADTRQYGDVVRSLKSVRDTLPKSHPFYKEISLKLWEYAFGENFLKTDKLWETKTLVLFLDELHRVDVRGVSFSTLKDYLKQALVTNPKVLWEASSFQKMYQEEPKFRRAANAIRRDLPRRVRRALED